MIEIKLPKWSRLGQIRALKKAIVSWWDLVESWLSWPMQQLDAETCSEGVLVLLAWQRNIQRFKTEPLQLYRYRIQHALANELDAGSASGLQRILVRMGIDYIEVEERAPGKDWDIIVLNGSESFISAYPDLLQIIVDKYGRTCRRYEWTTITPLSFYERIATFSHDAECVEA